jgi:hypothetical protein
MNTTTFRRKAETMFRKANPDATIAIEWTHGPVTVTWADGTKGISGTFQAQAPGFRTRPMCASLLDGEVAVR